MLWCLRSSSRSEVTWPHHPAQLPVLPCDTLENPDSETISLRRLIETRCPSVLTPFKPVWWLFNGHLQTAYAGFGDFTRVDIVKYDRKLVELKDGGTLGIDFTPPAKAGRIFAETTPVIVVLPGVTGDSYDAYVRNVVAPAVAPIEEGGLGYRAVVVNSRGCAGVPLSSPRFCGLSHTDDFRQAIIFIVNTYPKAPLLGLGFSLGANVLTRYVAEEGEQCRLISACALATPWDCTKTFQALEGTWFSRLIYSKTLGTKRRNVLSRHRDSIYSFPDTSFAEAFSSLQTQSRVMGTRFDTLITIKFGGSSPPFPFPDVHAYYAYSSSYNKLDRIRIPLLAFSADDDPITAWAPHGYADNEWFTLVLTRGGGHLGWFQSGEAEDRWFRRPVLEWLRATAEDVKVIPRNVREIECRDGWLVEIGSEHLGCREIGDGGMIKGTDELDGDLLTSEDGSSMKRPFNRV